MWMKYHIESIKRSLSVRFGRQLVMWSKLKVMGEIYPPGNNYNVMDQYRQLTADSGLARFGWRTDRHWNSGLFRRFPTPFVWAGRHQRRLHCCSAPYSCHIGPTVDSKQHGQECHYYPNSPRCSTRLHRYSCDHRRADLSLRQLAVTRWRQLIPRTFRCWTVGKAGHFWRLWGWRQVRLSVKLS